MNDPQNSYSMSPSPCRSKRAKKTVNNQYMYTCRACLTMDPTKTFQSLMEEPMRTTFWECTAIDVHEDENVPLVLCSLCVARCEAAKHFRDMVHDNDDKLRENQTVRDNQTIYVTSEEMDALDVDDETMKIDTDSIELELPPSEEAIQEESDEDEETVEEEGEVNFYETAAEEVVANEVFVVNLGEEGDQQGDMPISEEVVEEEIKQRKIAVTNQSTVGFEFY